jgi:hypothetical protein
MGHGNAAIYFDDGDGGDTVASATAAAHEA